MYRRHILQYESQAVYSVVRDFIVFDTVSIIIFVITLLTGSSGDEGSQL